MTQQVDVRDEVEIGWGDSRGETVVARTSLAKLQQAAADLHAPAEPGSSADEPGAYERLREIARLRGELNEIDLSIAAAKRAHERCKEYLELKDLREERKEIAAQLDVAELNAVQWSQSRLGL